MTEAVTSRRTALVTVGGATLALCLAGCAGSITGGSSAGQTTVPTSEVPVGGGVIVGHYVVTQPSAGSFMAFGYLCTHQNLPVQQVGDGAIVCGRHGSTFSLTDGSVLTGPATKALTKATATVSGNTVTIS